jgi:branched-subunit amino acid aminotransferase/4-amino-4-deoxychorismate lyase
MERPARMPVVVTAFCRPFKGKPAEWYTRGAPVVVAQSVVADQAVLSTIKSTNYLTKMMARREAEKAHAADALLTDGEGHYLEGSATNLFIVKSGVLVTPSVSDGILPGVTRSVILGIADTLDIPWDESPITDKMLKGANEIFLSGSTSEVLPVREVKGVCQKKAPGPVTQELWTAYRNLIS